MPFAKGYHTATQWRSQPKNLGGRQQILGRQNVWF